MRTIPHDGKIMRPVSPEKEILEDSTQVLVSFTETDRDEREGMEMVNVNDGRVNITEGRVNVTEGKMNITEGRVTEGALMSEITEENVVIGEINMEQEMNSQEKTYTKQHVQGENMEVITDDDESKSLLLLKYYNYLYIKMGGKIIWFVIQLHGFHHSCISCEFHKTCIITKILCFLYFLTKAHTFPIF